MTPAEERAIASKYMGGFAWPTVLLFIFNCTVFTGTIILCVNGSLPMYVGMIINSIITYFFYTIHHEANHGNISGQNKSLRWVDQVMGTVASLPLQLNFQAYSPSHLLHHAHTNIPGKDPDTFMAGPGKAVFPRWFITTIIKTFACIPFLADALFKVLPAQISAGIKYFKSDRPGLYRHLQASLLLLVVSFFFGQGLNFLLLWWLPTQFAQLILQVWFVWLPHVPFNETSRYRNTQIRGWIFSHVMLLGQDHHLIHHMYPRVPFFRYRRLFREIRPSLEANNASIRIPAY